MVQTENVKERAGGLHTRGLVRLHYREVKPIYSLLQQKIMMCLVYINEEICTWPWKLPIADF